MKKQLVCLLFLGAFSSLFAIEGLTPPLVEPTLEPPELKDFIQTDALIGILKENILQTQSIFKTSSSVELFLGLGLKGNIIGKIARKEKNLALNFFVDAEKNRDFANLMKAKLESKADLKLKNGLVKIDITGKGLMRELETYCEFQGKKAQKWSLRTDIDAFIFRRNFSLEFSTVSLYGNHKNELNWFPFLSASSLLLFRYYLKENLRAKFSLSYSRERIRDIMNAYLSDYSSFSSFLGLGWEIYIHYVELGFLLNTTYERTRISPYLKTRLRTSKFELASEYSTEFRLPVTMFEKLDPYVIPQVFVKEELVKHNLILDGKIFLLDFMSVNSTLEYSLLEGQPIFSFDSKGVPSLTNADKSRALRLKLELSFGTSSITTRLNFTYNRNIDKNNNQVPLEPHFKVNSELEIYLLGFKSTLNFGFIGRQETYSGAFINPYPVLSYRLAYRFKRFKFGVIAENIFNKKFEWYPYKYDTGSQGRVTIGYDI